MKSGFGIRRPSVLSDAVSSRKMLSATLSRASQRYGSAPRFTRLGAICLAAAWLSLGCSRTAPKADRAPGGEATETATPSASPRAEAAAPIASSDASRAAPAPKDATPLEPPSSLVLAGGRESVRAEHGLVVSVEAEATRAGVRVLEMGGNAVDAAVAVAFALAVTHPSAGNIGGGGFLLVRISGQATKIVDFRERAPSGLTKASFDSMIASGGTNVASVGIPGSVAGLLLALERFGTRPRGDVLAPAIELAERGYRLGKAQAASLRSNWRALRQDADLRRTFGSGGNRPLSFGALVRRPDLAATLRLIAQHGTGGFYRGPTAQALLKFLGAPRGLWSEIDLETYAPVVREPLRGVYRGLEIETTPPPSAGGATLLLTLGMLEASRAYELTRGDPLASHLLIEAFRRAQAERRFAAGDPDVPSVQQDIVSLDPAELLRRAPIDRKARTPSASVHPLYLKAMSELENTTHFSVIDRQGGIVSCTTTLSGSYGAKLAAPGTGIVLNNSVAAFGTFGNNLPAPGKRPTSSMSPTLVLSGGTPILVLGSPGGDTIPSTITQVLRNIVDFQLPLDAAVASPRLHHGFVPDEVRYEARRPPPASLLAALEKLGHTLTANTSSIGHANNLVIAKGAAWGYADPREGGLALAARAPSPASGSAVASGESR